MPQHNYAICGDLQGECVRHELQWSARACPSEAWNLTPTLIAVLKKPRTMDRCWQTWDLLWPQEKVSACKDSGDHLKVKLDE